MNKKWIVWFYMVSFKNICFWTFKIWFTICFKLAVCWWIISLHFHYSLSLKSVVLRIEYRENIYLNIRSKLEEITTYIKNFKGAKMLESLSFMKTKKRKEPFPLHGLLHSSYLSNERDCLLFSVVELGWPYCGWPYIM